MYRYHRQQSKSTFPRVNMDVGAFRAGRLPERDPEAIYKHYTDKQASKQSSNKKCNHSILWHKMGLAYIEAHRFYLDLLIIDFTAVVDC